MTVIAYKDGIMAADSWSVSGILHEPCAFPKILRLLDGGLVGGAGHTCDIWAAYEWFIAGRPAEKPQFLAEKETANALDLLWARPDGSLWRAGHGVDCWFPQSPQSAIGSAWSIAETAMAMGKTAAQAVQVCVEICVGIGGAVQVERIGHD